MSCHVLCHNSIRYVIILHHRLESRVQDKGLGFIKLHHFFGSHVRLAWCGLCGFVMDWGRGTLDNVG